MKTLQTLLGVLITLAIAPRLCATLPIPDQVFFGELRDSGGD